jgi:tRNA modification GTPase
MADTIAALSTAPAKSGVAVIRISGENAFEIAERVFRPRKKGDWKPGKMKYGSLLNREGKSIDSILAVRFKAPNSYTGEDLVELHCHGSPAVINSALSTIYSIGARPAKAGEFTKRAFLNGKLDLIRAEAVGDLIDAQTENAAINAAAQVEGALTREIGAIYDALADLLAHFHAVVDYPDEDIEDFGAENAVRILEDAAGKLERLADGYEKGKVLKEGIDCAIIGRPNVGKSSLMNALVGYDRAIVTPIAGTTRDIVEEYARIGGVTLRLRDTAGIRRTEDFIENMGVERAVRTAEASSLVFVVVDGSVPLNDEDRRVLWTASGKRAILLINKSDLPRDESILQELKEWEDKFSFKLSISARTGEGLQVLEDAIRSLYALGDLKPDGTLITNARQEGACRSAAGLLRNASSALSAGYPPDMVLYDVEQGVERIGDILGKNTRDDVVERIFANFCVGK